MNVNMEYIQQLVGRLTLDYSIQISVLTAKVEELERELAELRKPVKERKKSA